MSEREWESEVIDIDNDITAPGESKQTNRQIILALVSHQKPLTIHRKITSQSEFSQVVVTETLKYADTRFGSKVIMGRRLLNTKSIYRNLFVNRRWRHGLKGRNHKHKISSGR